MDAELPDDLFTSANDDVACVEYIKNYLPQELKSRFSDDDLFYFIDLLTDYYVESGLLDQEPGADGCIEINTEEVAKAIAKRAKKEKYGDFSAEELLWVVEGELSYGDQEEA